MPWQCTDKAAIKTVAKNRSCLAYDNTNGYTFLDGECIPSDYNGCIDTYNKFRDLKTCTQGKKTFIQIEQVFPVPVSLTLSGKAVVQVFIFLVHEFFFYLFGQIFLPS